jgi:hypothetical protein
MKRLLPVFILISVMSIAATNPVPFLNTKLYPTSSPSGHGAFTLTVTGSNFASGAVVNWNGSPRATTVLSSSRLQAAITAADIAHPGTASITVINPGSPLSNSVYFTVGTRSATLAFARHDLSIYASPYSIVTADFNHDGRLDIAVGSSTGGLLGTSAVQVFLGNGNGTFQSPITLSTNVEPDGMVAGDFLGNGNLDLIIGNELGNQLFLQGNGDGTFTPENGAGGYPPAAVADINHDGELDYITSGAEEGAGLAQVFLGNGDGTFTVGQQFSTSENPGGVAFGDFNRDGKLDVAIMNSFTAENLMVLPGNGDGTFGTAVYYKPANVGSYVAVGDITNSGKLDLVTDGMEVFLGDATGAFTDDGGVVFTTALGVALADFNNDNRLDALLVPHNSDGGANTLTVLSGNGDGTFQPAQSFDAGQGRNVFGVGDFNNDGRLDVASASTDQITGLPILSIFLQTALSISPTYINFGNVALGTSSAPQTVTLTNIGITSITLASIQITGSARSYSQTNDCSSTLAPGATCTVSVTFTPSGKKQLAGYVRIGYRGTTGTPQLIELIGTGD